MIVDKDTYERKRNFYCKTSDLDTLKEQAIAENFLTGSEAYCIDTATLYLWDEESQTYIEQA